MWIFYIKLKNILKVEDIRIDREICVYGIININDLNNLVVTHFDNYPLITEKQSDNIYWKKVINKMLLKEHLTREGFDFILIFYASINR